ncbi:MAG TPA: GGDEF domain-containing protein [Burkholderiales bacterium]|nr:GGDEF domain-containing protein [Burkholderiales bacterium]
MAVGSGSWIARAQARWQTLIGRLFMLPPGMVAPLCSGLLVAIVVIDFLTPARVDLSFLYVFVILLACWNGGAAIALVVAVVAALVQAVVLRMESSLAASEYWTLVLNRTFTFFLVIGLTMPLRKLYEREQQHARRDYVTGIPNRKEFIDRLELESARTDRHGRPFCVAYMDADDFKGLNDSRGHAEGDACLLAAAETMSRALRASDTVARLGGDEFALLLPETDSAQGAKVIERVRRNLAACMSEHGWPVSFSIGLMTFNRRAISVEDILSRCDELMYRVKRAGKGGLLHESL